MRPTKTEQQWLELRHLHLDGPITDQSAQFVIAKLLFLKQLDREAPVTFHINSPGGSVTAMFAIAETIADLEIPVSTRGVESAAGTALWLLAMGKVGDRLAQETCTLSIEATLPDERIALSDSRISRINAKAAEILASCSKLTAAEVLEALEHGRSFTFHDALRAGLIDGKFAPESN